MINMRNYSLPYGNSTISFSFEDKGLVEFIEPTPVPGNPIPLSEVVIAIHHPVNDKLLANFKEKRTISIAINDKTRPVPHKYLLPPLLQELELLGFEKTNIQFFIAMGTHKPMPASEYPLILPQEIVSSYRVVSHDCDQSEMANLGFSSRGTPIEINKAFLDADIKIVIGNIEPHHFSGFSGGYKSAVIGLGSRKLINKNHSLLMDENARIAEFESNPLRQDIEEIGQKINIDFALNTVLNSNREIVKCFFGDPHQVMLSGISVSSQVCQTPVKSKADLIIASVGGAPKDINLYQSQKALSHASLLTKDGGVVILVAACPEGSGSQFYEDFMEGVHSPTEGLEKFRHIEFCVGPHKAFQFCRELKKIRVILVSVMDSSLVEKLLLEPAMNMMDAITRAKKYLPADYSTAILPHATNTIPSFELD